jgi:DNA-binding NtrC family response regulator
MFVEVALSDCTGRIQMVDEDPGEDIGARTSAAPVAPADAMPSFGALMLLDADGAMRPLEDIEAEAIRFAVTHYRGRMSEVARRLRIGRSTLYRKLDALRLDAENADAEITRGIRVTPQAKNKPG